MLVILQYVFHLLRYGRKLIYYELFRIEDSDISELQ
jgi:hypothetical protein